MATTPLGNAIQRGVAADKPASGDATKAGQLYAETDTGALSHDDGSAWATVALAEAGADARYLRQDDNLAALASAATARTNLGLGTAATHPATDFYGPGGTDVAVADGGTGASTASAARTNLGLALGTDVEAHDADLTAIAGLSPADDDVLQRKSGAWANRTLAQLKADLALNPMTTQDDLIVGGASGAPARLAKGSDGQVLTVDPTTHHLVWATPSGGGGGSALTVEEVDGSPTDSAITKIVFPNGTLAIASHVATYTPAGGGGGDLTKLAQVVLSVATATISFTSIPGTHEDLILVWNGRSAKASTTDDFIHWQMNTDTGANYDSLAKHVYSGSAGADNQYTGHTSGRAFIGAASTPASRPSSGTLSIPGYARTTFQKEMTIEARVPYDTSSIWWITVHGSSVWKSTAAITQIDLFLEGGDNFVAGTVATLYGRG